MAYSRRLRRKLDTGYQVRQIIAMVMNFVCVALVFAGFMMSLGSFALEGWWMLADPLFWAPILVVIGTIVMGATQIRYLTRDIEIPVYAKELKLVGTIAIISAALLYLIGMIVSGSRGASSYVVFFSMILTPILMSISFLLEGRPELTIASAGKAIVPQVLLCIVLIPFNILSLTFAGSSSADLAQDLWAGVIQMALWVLSVFVLAIVLIQISQKIDDTVSR